MISVLEALTAISIFQPITEQIIHLGVGRDLVIIFMMHDEHSLVHQKCD